ncbi:hypothetical protein ACWDE9_05670, partial [Streptomyces olivaceoviridis]
AGTERVLELIDTEPTLKDGTKTLPADAPATVAGQRRGVESVPVPGIRPFGRHRVRVSPGVRPGRRT